MVLPGRTYNAGSYRYGFNTQEKSDEIGIGFYSAKFWEYDSRIVRRWDMDPILEYGESPYSCFGNNPISNTDFNVSRTLVLL